MHIVVDRDLAEFAGMPAVQAASRTPGRCNATRPLDPAA